MNAKEESYLIQFRELAARQSKIIASISEFRVVCESLKDWQRTAKELSTASSNSTRPEWSAQRLAEIADLRALLVDYHTLSKESERLWANLTKEEKIGLADPISLQASS